MPDFSANRDTFSSRGLGLGFFSKFVSFRFARKKWCFTKFVFAKKTCELHEVREVRKVEKYELREVRSSKNNENLTNTKRKLEGNETKKSVKRL